MKTVGRPKVADKKNRVAVRLYKWQIDLLKSKYKSTQKGINELIKQISE